jgi:SAM-dependent methyltransferase
MKFQNNGYMLPEINAILNDFFTRRLTKCHKILDYGCGYGGWTKYFYDRTSAKIIDLYEPDTQALEYCKKLIPVSNVNYGKEYDLIICSGVLELLSEADQEILLTDFGKKLQKNGGLIVQYNTYNRLSLRWIIIRILHGDPIKWHEKFRFHRSYLNNKSVEYLFERAGFKIIDKCAPNIENHLPKKVNELLSFIPFAFKSNLWFYLEK